MSSTNESRSSGEEDSEFAIEGLRFDRLDEAAADRLDEVWRVSRAQKVMNLAKEGVVYMVKNS